MNIILSNGNLITMDQDRPRAEAIAIANGCITAVGTNEDVLPLRQAKTELIDLKGKTAVPGFNDSHMHLMGYALTMGMVDLRQAKSIDALVAAIRSHINEQEINGGAWVFGWGWDQSMFRERQMPTRFDLDQASGEHNLVILRTCGHVCVANSTAMQSTGILESPPPVQGGSVELDDRGVPTGILKEKAMDLILGMFPPIDKDMIKSFIVLAAEEFLQSGLTSVQTDDLAFLGVDVNDLLQAYRELEAEDRLPVRVSAQLLLSTTEKLSNFLELGYRTGDGGEYFKIGPLKILTDGSLGGHTAVVSTPYADAPDHCGIPLLDREELAQLVELAHQSGMQCAAHAIGDGIMEMVLNAYQQAQEKVPRCDPRFRIIHASVVRPDLLERFREMGVTADIQPAFVASDHAFIEERLGKERARWTYCWQEFIKRGIPLAGGSDCPVVSYNPLLGIHAAVNRQNLDGLPAGGWMPEQKLTVMQALEIYTVGSAYCTFEEGKKGSITAGKLADLVVLDANIGKIPSAELKDISVAMTIVGGKVAYSSLPGL